MPKVLQGLIYAAAIGLAGLGFRLVYMHYAVETINDATTKLAEQQRVVQRRQVEQLTAQARHMAAPENGRALAANERCIGGSIVRVEMVNGVPTYTQVSDGARPVMCPMR